MPIGPSPGGWSRAGVLHPRPPADGSGRPGDRRRTGAGSTRTADPAAPVARRQPLHRRRRLLGAEGRDREGGARRWRRVRPTGHAQRPRRRPQRRDAPGPFAVGRLRRLGLRGPPRVAGRAGRTLRRPPGGTGRTPRGHARRARRGWPVTRRRARRSISASPRARSRPAHASPTCPRRRSSLRRAAVAPTCFDERLAAGEDVDLVWRLVEAGWDVRYVPTVEVTHEADLRPARWLARRALYGSTAGPLARRHGDAVAPARVSPVTAATWGLAHRDGRPVAASAVTGASTAVLGQSTQRRRRRPIRRGDPAHRSAATARSAAPAVAGLARAWAPAPVLVSLFVRRLGAVPLAASGALVIDRRPATGGRARQSSTRSATSAPGSSTTSRTAPGCGGGAGGRGPCGPSSPSVATSPPSVAAKSRAAHDG